MGVMTDIDTPTDPAGTQADSAYLDSFGTVVSPGAELAVVLFTRDGGIAFARAQASTTSIGERQELSVAGYRDATGRPVAVPEVAPGAPTFMSVLAPAPGLRGHALGIKDVFGQPLHRDDPVGLVLSREPGTVTLGAGVVVGRSDDTVHVSVLHDVPAQGLAASQVISIAPPMVFRRTR